MSAGSWLLVLCLLFIHPPAHGSEVSPAARNTLASARIPRASKLLICGLFQKVRVLAQDGLVSGGRKLNIYGGRKWHTRRPSKQGCARVGVSLTEPQPFGQSTASDLEAVDA